MKRFILIFLLALLGFICKAQYAEKYNPPKGWKSAELAIPAATLVGAFVVNDYIINNKSASPKVTAQIAATAMVVSVAMHFLFRKIRKNKAKRKCW